MNKNRLEPIRHPINAIRVLQAFVGHPQDAMTVKQLLNERGLRTKTNEKMIRKATDYLVRKKILRKIRPWGSRPKDKDKRAKYERNSYYELSKTPNAFKNVLDLYPIVDIDKLLASDYTDIVIGEIGFQETYKIIRSDILFSEFKQATSES